MFHSFERFIALRYLWAPKREKFISLITFLALIGIFLGVASLIIVTSVMNGFRQELLRQMTGIRGHVLIQNTYRPVISNYHHIQSILYQNDQVSLVLPTIEQQTMLIHGGRFRGVVVHGHDTAELKKHAYLATKVKVGALDKLNQEDTVMIGARLAEAMCLKIGESITLVNPKGEETVFGTIPKYRDFTIVAIFELGMREYDKSFIFTSLHTAQDFFNYPRSVTHIDVLTRDTHNISQVLQAHLQAHHIDNLRVLEWKHADASMFRALNIEKNVMFIILTLMIVIAVLNIVSSLIMLVKDKNNDIAILRTMGMSRASVMKIFFLDGAIIGVVGTVLGVIFGVAFAWHIETIRRFVERISGKTLFNAELYYMDALPAIINVSDIVMVVSISLAFSLLATLYPAIKAANLDPAKVLR